MIKVGDKVKLDIGIIEKNGMTETPEQYSRFLYILDNPDRIYEVSSTTTPVSLAQISLDDPILRETSFFEDELILVGGDRI